MFKKCSSVSLFTLVTSTATQHISLLIYTVIFSLSLTYLWLNYIQRQIFRYQKVIGVASFLGCLASHLPHSWPFE